MSAPWIIDRIEVKSCYAIDARGNYLGPRTIANGLAATLLSRRFIARDFGLNGTLCRGYCYNPSGESIPVPATRSRSEIISHEKVSNPSFKKRRAQGEVIMSPYKIDRLTVIQQQMLRPGSETLIFKTDLNDGENSSTFYYSDILPFSRWPFNNTIKCGGGTEWYFGEIWIYASKGPSVFWPTPVLDFQFWEESTRPFSRDLDNVLAQTAVSKAYGKAVDALTTLAELPETYNSIASILRNVADLVVHRRRKVAQLTQLFADKRAAIKKAFEIQIQVLSSQRPSTQAGIRRNNRAIARARKNLLWDLKRNSKGLATQLASTWLQFRYEIMPNYYTIQDLAKFASDLGNSFIRESAFKAQNSPPVHVDKFSATGTLVTRDTATCLLSLDVSNPFDAIRGQASFDPLVTAWELVPLSFVIDWFFTVGDALSVLTPPAATRSHGSCYAYKDVLNAVYTSDLDGSQTTVKRESYQRVVMSTEDFSGIYLNVELNWMRLLDTFSLSWNVLLRPRVLRK